MASTEKKRIEYKKRKEEKRCYYCGGQDARTLSGKSHCAKCAEYSLVTQRTRNMLRKKNHICVDCRKQDERTMAGYTRCKECAEKSRKNSAKRRQSLKSIDNK